MTAMQAARERLDFYIEGCVTRAKLGLSEPCIEPLVLRHLEDELILCARREETPF